MNLVKNKNKTCFCTLFRKYFRNILKKTNYFNFIA